MDQAAFLALLATKYLKVGTPEIVEPQDPNGVTRYIVNVVEEGLSDEQEPVIYRKNVNYYVIAGNGQSEKAGFERKTPQKSTGNGGIANDNSLAETAKVYNSNALKDRMSAAIITAAKDIVLEAETVPNHALRLKTALSSIVTKDKYLNAFLAMAALDSTIRTKGHTTTDQELLTMVNDYLTIFAIAEFS